MLKTLENIYMNYYPEHQTLQYYSWVFIYTLSRAIRVQNILYTNAKTTIVCIFLIYILIWAFTSDPILF